MNFTDVFTVITWQTFTSQFQKLTTIILVTSSSFSFSSFDVVSFKKLLVSITSAIILSRIPTSWMMIRISGYPHQSKFVANNYWNEVYHRTVKYYKIICTKIALIKWGERQNVQEYNCTICSAILLNAFVRNIQFLFSSLYFRYYGLYLSFCTDPWKLSGITVE